MTQQHRRVLLSWTHPGCVISRIASGRFWLPVRRLTLIPQSLDSSGPATPTTLADVDWPKELTRVSLTVLAPSPPPLVRLNSFFFQR